MSEKLALVWSIILPVVIAVLYQKSMLDSVSTNEDLIQYFSRFWVFILFSCFVNGIGLQLARLREQGLLKTYTFIAGNKYPIVFGTILTQIVFCLVSLLIFTIIILIIYGVFEWKIFLLPIILLLVSLPFSLLVLFLANLPFQYNNFSVIVNFLTYPLFILSIISQGGSLIELLNPFYVLFEWLSYISGLLNVTEYKNINYNAVITLGIYTLVGYFSLKKLNLLSVVQR
jgi:ABC-2 type transport system permease protein